MYDTSNPSDEGPTMRLQPQLDVRTKRMAEDIRVQVCTACKNRFQTGISCCVTVAFNVIRRDLLTIAMVAARVTELIALSEPKSRNRTAMSQPIHTEGDRCVLCGGTFCDAEFHRDGSGTNSACICVACCYDLERDLQFEFEFPWDHKAESGEEKKEVVTVDGPGGSTGN